MRAHYLQHVPFEGLGSIEQWLRKTGYEISATAFFESAELPEINEFDLLVVMGGPMSVHDVREFPWLLKEKQFIRRAIQSGKSILGVCLGAQLIASAMDARVYQNRLKEIGWFPVQGTPSSESSLFRFPSSVEVFHWHGETFDLPSNAIRIAKSEVCENQAFQIGTSVIGLQFHLETTPESARKIVSNCHAELSPTRFVQSEKSILDVAPEKYSAINRLMDEVLTFLHNNSR